MSLTQGHIAGKVQIWDNAGQIAYHPTKHLDKS